MPEQIDITCPYCNNVAKLVNGKEIYPHRPDLYEKSFYQCEPCGAYVGCHPGTKKPLGRLANSELRKAKSTVHRVFDPIWKNGEIKRYKAYQWLADKLGIDILECHIGMFNIEICKKAIDICCKEVYNA